MSDDILDRLRNWDAGDNSHSSAESMMEMAADEIEQLRGNGTPQTTLTDAERDAVQIAIEYVGSASQVEHHAATLHGLLKRMR